jgi:hypothetical protein
MSKFKQSKTLNVCFACLRPFSSNKALAMHQTRSTYCQSIICSKLNDKVNAERTDMKYEENAPSISSFNEVSNFDSLPGNNNETSETINLHHLQHTTLNHASHIESIDNGSGKQSFENITTNYTNNLCHEIKLLKIIQQLGMPLYSYKTIMDWAQEINMSCKRFQPQNSTYQQAIKHFEKMLNLQNCRPYNIPVKLNSDNMELNVVVFNVPAMLQSLFNDEFLNCYDNLVINTKHTFAKYEPPDDRLGEANSGRWYQTAYKTCIQDPDKDFLCPLILASDKTTLSDMGDLHVDAIFMSTSIFNYQVCLVLCINVLKRYI